MTEKKIQGTVTRFSNKKGFGFIRPDGWDHDIFIYYMNVNEDTRKLYAGDLVEFNIETNNGRDHAVDVEILLRVKEVRGALKSREYHLWKTKDETRNFKWRVADAHFIETGEPKSLLDLALFTGIALNAKEAM
jgi:cold shock CspA family protein